MEKIKYIVYKEKPGSDDLVEVFASESLEEAKNALNWKENLYGRIEKVNAIYTPPPIGKIYKEEQFGWSNEFLEIVAEK